MLTLTMANTIEFYLVEEGIKQNEHTLCLEDAVSRMMWNCAHAELKYEQEIQTEMPKEIGDRDFLAFFHSALSGNTKRLSQVHRDIYDRLMADNGPYKKLMNHIRQEHGPQLKEIETEFFSYNAQREVLEKSAKKQKQAVDNMKALLMELEEKLTKKSRFTLGRRRANKLKSINTQISHLRESIETTSAAYMEDEAKLKSLVSSKKKTLQILFLKLKKLDRDSYTVIHEVISQYAKDTIPRYDFKLHDNTESSTNLDAIDIQVIHSRNWTQTEERARLKRAGLVKGMDMFLVPSLSGPKQNLDLCIVEDGTKTKSRPTVPSHPPIRREQQDSPQRNKRTSSSHSSAACPSSYDAGMKNALVSMKYPSPLVTDLSEDEMETLELPKETPRRLPNPFTMREFCAYEADTSQKL